MKRLLYAMAGVVGLAAMAQAGPVTVSDSGGGIQAARAEAQLTGFPGYTRVSPIGTSNADGYHNGLVTLLQGTYELSYWGSGDSVFTNTFTLNPGAGYTIDSGGPIVSTGPGGLGGYTATPYVVTVTGASATLNFTYSTTGGGTPCAVDSGAAIGPDCNYLAGVDGALVSGPSTTGNVGFLGFADRVEAVDTDHQDLTIRIAVPEPVSLALFGAGLVSLGIVRRRRTQV